MPVVVHDLIVAARRLRAAPAFALFSIVTLALGIGAATAVFSLIRNVTAPPPGVGDVERVVEVFHASTGSVNVSNLSWADYQDLRSQQTVFEQLTGWTMFRSPVVANAQALQASGEFVDGGYFRTLRVPAALGRTLSPSDDRPDAPCVAVISDAFWRRVFDASPAVVGITMKIGGASCQIAGVASPDFRGLFNGGLAASSIWIPMAAMPSVAPSMAARLDREDRDRRWVFVRARLRPGETVASASAAVAVVGKRLDAAFPIGTSIPELWRRPYSVSRPWGVRQMDTRMMGVPDSITRTLSAAVLLAVAIVVLVACTNLAHLMLARNSRRQAELGVRAALGASRAQLVRSALAEPLWLVAAGGLLGLVLARVLMHVLGAGIDLNGWTLQAQPTLDLASLGASLVAVALVLIVAGLWPAWRATRVDVRSVVASDTAASSPRWRGRRYLIAVQVTVSVVLVLIAALQTSALRRQGRIDWGIDLDRLAVAQVDLASHGYDLSRTQPLVSAVLGRLEHRPGVESVAAVSSLPTMPTTGGYVSVAGQSTSERVRVVAVTPGALETLGVVLSRGRSVEPADTPTSPPVIVLSDSSARATFGSTDPMGREVLFRQEDGSTAPSRALTVVGIADARKGSQLGRADVDPVAYVAMAQDPPSSFVIAARAAGQPSDLIAGLRQAIAETDREIAVARLGTGLTFAGQITIFYEVVAWLSSSLGGVALVIALAGLYGVLSHVVTGRTREIGVRLALGADNGRIRRMLLVEGLSPVAMGLAAGGALVFAGSLAARAWMPQVLPSIDPWLAALVVAVVLLAGYAAVHSPARRASRIDPNHALRSL